MEFWRTFLANPSKEKSMNDFAIAIDSIPKIVFSHTLKSLDWETATLATSSLKDTLSALKQQPGKAIFIGSHSLIIQTMQLNLIDEYQLCVYPVIAGRGFQLFDGINDRTVLKLTKTRAFDSGAIILYYEPTTNKPGER